MANPVFSFDEARHLYRDAASIMRPSVSQILKAEGLISFDGINPAVLEHKRRLGTLVHKVTALYDQGEDLTQYEIPDEVWPYFDGWLNFRNDCKFTPRLIERQALVQVHGMWYGMKLDNEGPINGEDNIIEKKCGSSRHPAWGVQLAGYDLGEAFLEKRLMPIIRPSRGRTVVQLGPQFARKYKTHPYTELSDYTVFVGSLANACWKINKNIPIFDNIPERIDTTPGDSTPAQSIAQPIVAVMDAPRELCEGVLQ